MILKPTVKGLKNLPVQKSKKENTLPPDEYEPMFEPIRFLVRETDNSSHKGPFRQYLEISVKRYDDEEAKPFVYVQMYLESDMYTGYMRGSSIHFPLDSLFDVIDNLTEISETCEKLHIED